MKILDNLYTDLVNFIKKHPAITLIIIIFLLADAGYIHLKFLNGSNAETCLTSVDNLTKIIESAIADEPILILKNEEKGR